AVVNAAQNGVLYTPPTDFVGVETFTYEISYGTLARAQGRVTVRVVDRRNELSPRDDFFTVGRSTVGNRLNVLANDNILPGANSSLTVHQLSNPTQGGTVLISGSGANSVILYTPRPGFIGRETFSYEIVDNQGGTGTANVTVDVGGLFTTPDQFSVLTDTAANQLNVLANDNIMPELGSIYRIVAVDSPLNGGAVSIQSMG